MKISSLFLLMLLPFIGIGQSFWKSVDESRISLRSNQERQIIPRAYAVYQLDMNKLKSFLSEAPDEMSDNRRTSMPTMNIPMPDGTMDQFYIYESSVMMEGLAAKYSNIKSYKGYSTTDRSRSIRFDVSINGFRASIRSIHGGIYIDNYAKNDVEHYISYFTKDFEGSEYGDVPKCGVDDHYQHSIDGHHFNSESNASSRSTEEVPLRTVRLALACTGEWGQWRGTLESALADMVTAVNRLNLIFENEMAIRLILIDNNDELIHLDPLTHPYQNSSLGQAILPENTNIINNIIGFSSYDIGHVFGRCGGVGGIAYLGSVCNGNKGGGVTCQNGSLTPEVVSITSHEMGHQFSANHTFNNCGGNENGGTAFEPGSGSTIMSYSGLCQSNNVKGFNINDDYYHQASLEEIYNFSKNGGSGDVCSTDIPTSNHAPEIIQTYNEEYVIPISTPFELTGTAIDEDGDVLTFCWEEKDLGPQVPLGQPEGNAPSFRSVIPSLNPTRLFPSIENINLGTQNRTEVLPTYSRNFNFAFTVRDNNPEAGMAVWDYVSFSSTDQAGPFTVEYPNDFVALKVGEEVTVQWDVANTDVAPVNCQNVNIYLSTDGGQSFDVILRENVPNTGSAEIIVPNNLTILGRIKVKAADNIFLDISDKNFRIEEPTEPAFYVETDASYLDICFPDHAIFEVNTVGFAGLEEDIQFEVEGLPSDAIATLSNSQITPGESATLDVDFNNVEGTGSFPFVLRAFIPEVDTIERPLLVSLTGTDFSDINLLTPETNTIDQNPVPEFEWTADEQADSYTLEISTSPTFENNIATIEDLTETNYTLNFILDPNAIYFWRINGVNKCTEDKRGEIRAFSTAAFICETYEANNLPQNITGSGTADIEARINVLVAGTVGDLNINLVKGTHERVGDLIATVIAPSGKEVRLWTNKCSTQSNFSCAFDDDAPALVNCPLNQNETFIPEQLLSGMSGEDVTGIWKLRLEDNKPGAGGKLTDVRLELCSSIVRSDPYLVNNEVLPVVPGISRRIKDSFLLAEDDVHDKFVLVYTLTKLPDHGQLLVNDEPLDVGETFRQFDIDQLSLRYLHNGNDAEEDRFRFSVTNPDGGWTGIQEFVMEINPDFVSSNEEIDLENNVIIYPNPATDNVFIRLEGSAQSLNQLEIMDISGRIVLKTRALAQNVIKIETSTLKNGIYVVRMSDGTRVITKKLVVH